MIKKFAVILSTMLFCSCSCHYFQKSSSTAYDPVDSLKSVTKISVEVITPNGSGRMSGTAWAIDEDHLLTAAHVCVTYVELKEAGPVGDYMDLEYFYGDKINTRKIAWDIMFSDVSSDLCLLRAEDHGFIPLNIAEDLNISIGDTVYVVGAPLGFIGFITEGRLVNKSVDLSPSMLNRMIVSAAATGGNSGGPVLNEYGQVIGVLVAGARGFDHLSICSGLEGIKKMLVLAGLDRSV